MKTDIVNDTKEALPFRFPQQIEDLNTMIPDTAILNYQIWNRRILERNTGRNNVIHNHLKECPVSPKSSLYKT